MLLLPGRIVYGLGFFFQAEDGIRDGTVTGVQTCALPISGTPSMSFFGMIATAGPGYARSGTKAADGCERVISTVPPSTARAPATRERSAFRGDCERKRSTDATTSSAVSGLPSWNLTPLRRW